jgi:hypothetical protein
MLVNSLLDFFQKRSWVTVIGNEGGIKVETPQAGPDFTNQRILNARVEEALIKTS